MEPIRSSATEPKLIDNTAFWKATGVGSVGNPVEMAQRIHAVIVDAEPYSARAALDIARILIDHRASAETQFVIEEMHRRSDDAERAARAACPTE